MVLEFINTLEIPVGCLINQRIPKVSITEGAVLGATEKKLLKEEVEEVRWLAAFKPTNCAIPAYADDTYLFNEVHYLLLELKQSAKFKKAAEMLQKAMPYPLIIWIVAENEVCLCGAEKRINQNDKSKRTLESLTFTPWLPLPVTGALGTEFIASLSPHKLPNQNLKAFYNGIMARVVNLQAAQIAGYYVVKSAEGTQQDAERLNKVRQLGENIFQLKKEIKAANTAFSEQVILHAQLKKLEAERDKLLAQIH